ncbi:MAG: rod shape-determining protein MreD [Arenicellales bacterium]|nr:rod shape-determining protein MreD [Arenicellales bacterium]
MVSIGYAGKRWWVIALSFFLALCFSVMALGPMWALWAPDWISLVLIYWCLAVPMRVGVGVGWTMGLLLDVATFGLIGRLALTKALIAYIAQRFALRLRAFPVWQQACAVFLLLGLEALIITLLALMMGESDAGRPGRWVAVLMGAVLWPVIFISLRRMRRWARLP